MISDEERFLALTRPDGDCLVWRRKLDDQGYGRFTLRGRRERAHRAAWKIWRGPIPHRKLVLHRCDNPSCVKIEHLFLGTHADNSRDMVAKRRHHNGPRTYHRRGVPVRIEGPLDCHIWCGATTTPRGYPVMKVDGKTRLARRVIYERGKRPLQPGEHVYTACEQRLCVRLEHLEARRRGST